MRKVTVLYSERKETAEVSAGPEASWAEFRVRDTAETRIHSADFRVFNGTLG